MTKNLTQCCDYDYSNYSKYKMSTNLLIIIAVITYFDWKSQCRKLKLEHIQKLYLIEGYENKAEYNLTIIKMIEKQEQLYTKKGKILYLEHYSEINTLDSFYSTFSREWIFLMDITNEIQELIKDITFSKFKYLISPIIIPNSLNYSFDEIISFIPIFQVDYDIFNELKTYDVRNATGNYFLIINYGKSYKNAPIRYLSVMAFVSIMISSWMLLLWKIRYDRAVTSNANSNRCLIGKKLVIFLLLKMIISMLLYYKIKLIESNSNSSNQQQKKNLVHYFILSFSLVFKMLFWFFSLFIAIGYEIIFSSIDSEHIKNFFKKYVVIYCILSIDETIDNMFSLNNQYVRISTVILFK